MNDNPFAPPRDLDSSTHETAGAPGPGSVDVHDAVHAVDAPAPYAAPATYDAPVTNDTVELPPSPLFPPSVEPRRDAPTGDTSPFLPPTEPPFGTPHRAATPSPGRLRRSTVAMIAAGALVLGAGAGFGGAWAYDTFAGDGSTGTATTAGSTLPTSSSSTIARTDQNTVAAIAAAALPSVVSIENVQGGRTAGEGSGFIIREDGYILTNNHVVDGSDNDTVTVVMSDGAEYQGTVVGATADYDLAVVKIDKTGLTPLVLGDSDALVVGDDVIAVGSPLGLQSTVTTGIVSALHRPVTAGDASSSAYIDAIQTDAAINPGNSGGPLLNSQGEVIGINSAIAALPTSGSAQAGSVGLGFAITSNQARTTSEELIATGAATYPVVGVVIDGSYTGEGVQVAQTGGVAAGGPAEAAGVQEGDVITAIDGRPITRGDELVVAIRAKSAGDVVTLTVERDGGSQEIDVTLAANTAVDYGDAGSSTDPGGSGDGTLPEPSE
ncbi:trypsin-like peptidase domain-containing protein [Demequina sp.]|uniref:S1C family serine protease n=1 Tax=Demequina sp. TaxID=2050685 RepID=UPI0025FCEB23|nr:trypsin-like peptidase domain-containing protein [Demequina sp.]